MLRQPFTGNLSCHGLSGWVPLSMCATCRRQANLHWSPSWHRHVLRATLQQLLVPGSLPLPTSSRLGEAVWGRGDLPAVRDAGPPGQPGGGLGWEGTPTTPLCTRVSAALPRNCRAVGVRPTADPKQASSTFTSCPCCRSARAGAIGRVSAPRPAEFQLDLKGGQRHPSMHAHTARCSSMVFRSRPANVGSAPALGHAQLRLPWLPHFVCSRLPQASCLRRRRCRLQALWRW